MPATFGYKPAQMDAWIANKVKTYEHQFQLVCYVKTNEEVDFLKVIAETKLQMRFIENSP